MPISFVGDAAKGGIVVNQMRDTGTEIRESHDIMRKTYR